KSTEVRKALPAEIKALRDEFNAAMNKLREEFRTKLGRAPLVQDWAPGKVFYLGDVASHAGSTYQAKRDTCQPVTSADDWTLLAGRGQDGVNGRTPRFRGAFLAGEKYAKFDVVRYDVGAFIAVRDNPGIIPTDGDGWQLLTLHGGRGPEGPIGAPGRKGERGARGEAAPSIISWVVDPVHYRVALTMSDGKAGPILE